MFDSTTLGRDFPALASVGAGPRLVHLDNAAATVACRDALAAFTDFHGHGHSADARTALLESARVRVARAVGASDPRCVVFCAGTTQAIHLVASAWGESNVAHGDDIVVSSAEHVANLACWHALALRRGARLRVIPVETDGTFPVDALRGTLSERTRLVAITHVSNVTGAVFPIREIIGAAHGVGARVLIDGAQAVAHMPVEFAATDADFYAFSAHKAYAVGGIGVLLAKRDLLDAMPPVLLGANAFAEFTLERRILAAPPGRFEGGTVNVAGAAALAAAFEFIERLGWQAVAEHEQRLCRQLDAGLASIRGVKVLGGIGSPVGIRSFVVEGRDAFAIQSDLLRQSVEIRAGHLAAQTLLQQLGARHALRVSIAACNDRDDIERCVAALAAGSH